MKIKHLLTVTMLASTLMISANGFAATEATATPTTTGVTAATSNATATTAPAEALPPAQVKQIQKVIHDYLLENPQLIVQVIQELQNQQQAKMQEQAIKSIQANANTLFNDADSPVAGNPNGTVALVEFFDYQCPHCKAMAPTIENIVKQDKNLKVIFKEFPIFPGSNFAAQAALAAKLQGKYWEFHNELMAANNPLKQEDVLAIAKKVGLNVEQLQKDMNSDAIKNELLQNQQLAEKLYIDGTPAFIIQSNKDKTKTFFIPGQLDQASLQQYIQKAS